MTKWEDAVMQACRQLAPYALLVIVPFYPIANVKGHEQCLGINASVIDIEMCGDIDNNTARFNYSIAGIDLSAGQLTDRGDHWHLEFSVPPGIHPFGVWDVVQGRLPAQGQKFRIRMSKQSGIVDAESCTWDPWRRGYCLHYDVTNFGSRCWEYCSSWIPIARISVPSASTSFNLNGNWSCVIGCRDGHYNNGQAMIRQDGGDLTEIVNEFGAKTKGRFISTDRFVTDWAGGLQATVTDGGASIRWDNGSVWRK